MRIPQGMCPTAGPRGLHILTDTDVCEFAMGHLLRASHVHTVPTTATLDQCRFLPQKPRRKCVYT